MECLFCQYYLPVPLTRVCPDPQKPQHPVCLHCQPCPLETAQGSVVWPLCQAPSEGVLGWLFGQVFVSLLSSLLLKLCYL